MGKILRHILFLTLLLLTTQASGEMYREAESNAYVFSDLLVFKLRTGGSDNWGQEITPAAVNQSVKMLGVPFKWSPGIRLGLGSNYSDCDWNLVFTYTGYQTKGENEISASNGGIHSSFLGNFFIDNTNGANITGPSYQSANIQWKLSYNVFDLELGRIFQVDSSFRLQPSLGLKCAFIDQKILSNWQNPTVPTTFTSASESLKNNFWGIGPSLGLNTDWSLLEFACGDLSLFSHLSGAIQWGQWRFQDIYTNNTPASVSVNLSPIKGAASMARGLLGIKWFSCFKGGTKLGIKLGYEAQVWFNQSQFYSLNMGRTNNLMSLQGGVLGLELVF